ncbi:MAG TPA: patatin-like phospholipase family protein [Steroidobacteraceae bacterium]|nr:patatin-like phospholipase family protein [Steroidobacteraceae bacterium]
MLLFFATVRSTRAVALRLGVLKYLFVAWLVAPAITDAQATNPAATGTEAPQRPRIGLVLSGGGARGTAHIGVLKVLEQMRVPIDAIAGSSMGAVVGGLYASGLSPRDIEKIMTSINWQDAFRDRPPRADLDLRRKEEDETFLVKFPLGVRDGRIVLPKGLIQGQKLTETLRRLTLPVARISNFDDLPTPFRAVATDLETGETAVLSSGDLTSAMRASLSAPGVFAPVDREGRLLVDGGISDNVPVDIARTMGVDVLIVVDVGSPLLPRQQLTNAGVISNQMLAILIQRNTREQLATLTPKDVLIKPQLGNASAFDFGAVARVIGAGETAARASAGQLAALAVSEDSMQRYTVRREAQRIPPPRIDFVEVDAGAERYGPPATKLFGELVGKPLDPDAVARRVTALYGRGGLDTLDYHVIGDASRYGLAIDARPSSLGTNYLRFGLSLQDDFQGNANYSAAMRFVMADITRNAGEWVTDLQIGSTSAIASELFLPLASFSGWFVMPHISDEARPIYVFDEQTLLAEYRVHTFEYGVDFGRQFGNWGEIRVGVQRQQGHYVLAIGDPSDPNLPEQSFTPFNQRNYFARLTYDRLDNVNFPRSGQQATLQWSGNRDVSGIGQTSDQVTGSYVGAYSFGRDTLSFSASGGMTLQAHVTDLNLQFPLGGFLNLSGLRTASLLGPDFGILRALYYRQIGRGGPGYLDLPTYLGLSLEVGNVWQSRSEASFGNTRKDASVFLGLDTFLGPVYLATGFDSHGNQQYFLYLGHTF